MNSQNLLARACGFSYVVLIVSGIFGIAHVPATLIDWTNPGLTVANIQASELLFRLGIVSQVICFIAFICLPLMLYRLLGHAGKNAALFMLAFSLISVPISLLGTAHYLDVLYLLSGSGYLEQIPLPQLELEVMSHLAAVNNRATLTNIFAGLWLFPFGYLVYRSGLLPKIFGVLLIMGGFGYLVDFFIRFFSLPELPWYVNLISHLGVFGIALWLLLLGVRNKN